MSVIVVFFKGGKTVLVGVNAEVDRGFLGVFQLAFVNEEEGCPHAKIGDRRINESDTAKSLVEAVFASYILHKSLLKSIVFVSAVEC